MSSPPIIRQIFLSCVTKEFLPHRKMLAGDLSIPSVKVQAQEDFVQGKGTLLEKLDDYIKGSDAVVHLVGSATGFPPKPEEVSTFLKRYPDFANKIPCLKDVLQQVPASLSYTQWEAWLALYHGVPCYVYRADATTVRAANFIEDPNERKKQDEHFDRFRSFGKDRATFESDQHLCRLVLRSLNDILPPGHRKVRIVPKGLLSFDANDADFYLDLVPGPRDKDGLPESIRFWKYRIESRDSLFTIGVIYGPSGCGKSSLVKAGLLPRLAAHVESIYVEATAESTESSLLTKLQARFPEIPKNLGPAQSVAHLRQNQLSHSGRKILIVIDQFEQCLHPNRNQKATELLRALELCDVSQVQCILLVRDDFWVAMSRFLAELNVKMLEGENTARFDLFDQLHSRNVLREFGQAFGRIDSPPSGEQEAFLDQAITGLARDNQIVPVRLALFAQMFKGRHWISSELKKVGGAEGIGVTFLEETFASAKYRHQLKASQKVLKALMPDASSDIRGQMQSHEKLMRTSGHSKRPELFEELLQRLDGDLKLIKGTEPDKSSDSSDGSKKFYQLTHDYLVPSLREWLTRKQKETYKGRAELLLEDQAKLWDFRRENRHLPSSLEWLKIQCLTVHKRWSSSQQKMMQRATRLQLIRGASWGLVLTICVLAGLFLREQWSNERRKASALGIQRYSEGLVERVLDADIAEVQKIVGEVADYWHWVAPMLKEEWRDEDLSEHQKLNVTLVLLDLLGTENGNVADLVNYLCDRLLDAKPNEILVICDSLKPHQRKLRDRLWAVVESPEKGKESQRLRAASALAQFDPSNEQWKSVEHAVAADMVQVPAVHLSYWTDCLRPVRVKLIHFLSAIYRDSSRPETERSLATDILVDFSVDQPETLANLVMDADEKQFAKVSPELKDLGETVSSFLLAEINKGPFPSDLSSSVAERERRAKRQANATVALLRLNQPQLVWPLLKHSPDPRVRSYMIHRFAPLGVDPHLIIQQLSQESDITIRMALVLSLGEYDEQQLPEEERNKLLPTFQEIYLSDTDPGLRSAVEWLLRKWNQTWVRQINLKLAKGGESHPKERKSPLGASPYWYVNGLGQTMVVLPGPVEFRMGSPTSEAGRYPNEKQHSRRIGRTFAIATTPLTVEQYELLITEATLEDAPQEPRASLQPDCNLPKTGMSWFDAAVLCNMLSLRERLQTCYTIDGDTITMKENYLSLNGYRLPTEAEMEYATRANALTSHFFGESAELLAKYEYYQANSGEHIWPVGLLKPNDFGLFDVGGNVFTWCQERHKPYPDDEGVTDDLEDELFVDSSAMRVVRGGFHSLRESLCRSAYRNFFKPTSVSYFYGLRPVRTITPVTRAP